MYLKIWFSCPPPNNWERNCFPLRINEPRLHETIQPIMVSNFSGC
nr:MAG TPA: hypothetical protein [Caudoviricetes sp.]